MPVGFLKSNGAYMLVALQGIQAGTNLFVDSNGTWIGGYVPQNYACYPFLLLSNEENEKVLCIDEDANMVSDVEHDTSLPFFDSNNAPTEKLNEVLAFLARLSASQEQTLKLCSLLEEYDLLRPWEIKIQADEDITTISNLACIDEEKLSELSHEALEVLHRKNVLPIIYGQLFSMHNLEIFARIGQNKILAHEANSAKETELNFDLVGDGDSLNFDNL